MAYHLVDGYNWVPGSIIPSNKILPVMFLSRCLEKAELGYGPSEQEVACLVWAVKKLRTMIHSSCQPVVVLTDHSATKGIVEKTSLDIASTERANRRLINASIYLSQYSLHVYHLPGRLNFVPDALSRLVALQDTPERSNGEAILDDVWLAFSEAKMEDSLLEQFAEGYRTDKKYSAIIDDLITMTKATEDSGEVFSQPGLPFVLVNKLLYNIRPNGLRALCVPHAMVKTILASVHDEKHHFSKERMLHDLSGLSIYRKTHHVSEFVDHCPQCNLNTTDCNLVIGNY